MDTYFSTSSECTLCGACVDACHSQGLGWLNVFSCVSEYSDIPKETKYIDGMSDDAPCHHCDGFWSDSTPCQSVCKNKAINISRW